MNKTKLVFMTLLLAALSFSTLQAQIGVRAGVNVASVFLDGNEQDLEDIKNTSIFTPTAGVYFPIKITDYFAIQPEISFIQKGGVRNFFNNVQNYDIEEATRLNFLEIPVVAKYYIGDGTRFFVEGGPSAAIAINGRRDYVVTGSGLEEPVESSVDIVFDNKDSEEYAKRFEYGATVGAGAIFGKVMVNLRYGLGFNNLLDNDVDATNDNKVLRTRGLSLTAGVEF